MLVSDLPFDLREIYSDNIGRDVYIDEEVDLDYFRGTCFWDEVREIYQGCTSFGVPSYVQDEHSDIFEGCTPYGVPQYCRRGNFIYEGCTPFGIPKYCIEGNRVYEGCTPAGIVAFTLY